MRRERMTPEQIHARLIFCIASVLSLVFAFSVFALLYALIFVTQPMTQAPNDAAFIELVTTLTIFLTGSLTGVLASNGLKSRSSELESNEPKGEE